MLLLLLALRALSHQSFPRFPSLALASAVSCTRWASQCEHSLSTQFAPSATRHLARNMRAFT
eukprot:14404959-Alexandrium_andersonii.AAC.1